MSKLYLKIPEDKLKHLILFGMIGAFLIVILNLGFKGWLITLILAIGKEIVWDKLLKKGTPEISDVIYSMVLPDIILIIDTFIIK